MGLAIVVTTSPEIKLTSEKDFDRGELGIDEWEDLVFSELGFPEPKRHPGEDRESFHRRWESEFSEHIAKLGYHQVGRVWHFNRDVFFPPEQVRSLHEECTALRKRLAGDLAISGVSKIISACERALSVKSGIWLYAD